MRIPCLALAIAAILLADSQPTSTCTVTIDDHGNRYYSGCAEPGTEHSARDNASAS